MRIPAGYSIPGCKTTYPDDRLRLEKPFEVESLTTNQWAGDERQTSDDVQVLLTDGNNKLIWYRKDKDPIRGTEGFSLGELATIFQADVFAILQVEKKKEVQKKR